MEINPSYIRRLNDATETMYENLLLTETNLFLIKLNLADGDWLLP